MAGSHGGRLFCAFFLMKYLMTIGGKDDIMLTHRAMPAAAGMPVRKTREVDRDGGFQRKKNSIFK